MLAANPINGFVRITDAKNARRFYEEIFGLAFVSENPYVAIFRSGETMIVAQKMKEFEPIHATVLGWEVQDIENIVSFLSRKGVAFERFPGIEQDELGIWKGPDGKVAWFKDPDGNLLSVSEHPTS